MKTAVAVSCGGNMMHLLPVSPVEKSWEWLGSVISSVIESSESLDDPPIMEPIIDLRKIEAKLSLLCADERLPFDLDKKLFEATLTFVHIGADLICPWGLRLEYWKKTLLALKHLNYEHKHYIKTLHVPFDLDKKLFEATLTFVHIGTDFICPRGLRLENWKKHYIFVSVIGRGVNIMIVVLLNWFDPAFLYSKIDDNDMPTK